MAEKGLAGAVGDRAAGRPPAAPHPDPARLEQRVERSRRALNAANFLDFGAGDGLVIGDDRKGLERGFRESPLLDGVLLEQVGQVFRRTELPLAGDPREIDAAAGVRAGEICEQRADVVAGIEMTAKHALVQRLGRREQQCFEHPQLLGVFLGRERRALGRPGGAARLGHHRQMRHIRLHLRLVPLQFRLPHRILLHRPLAAAARLFTQPIRSHSPCETLPSRRRM